MTARTEYQPSPVEMATQGIVADLNRSISLHYAAERVPTPEEGLRRILALFFVRQTEEEWQELLGIKEHGEGLKL